MNTLDGFPILDHYKQLLATGKQQDAWKILQEFFDYFQEDSPRDYLWYILVTALKNDGDGSDGRTRVNMIFFYEYCTALFKAAETLCRQQEKRTRKKKTRVNLSQLSRMAQQGF